MLLFAFLFFAYITVATHFERRQAPAGVPQYVVDYAPIVYLHSADPYRPADIGSQLVHTQPDLNFTLIKNAPNPLTLNNLNVLNHLNGENGTYVYLTSKQDVTTHPAWLNGVTPNGAGKTNGAISCAIIVNDHGNGRVDAFYMYFYAFDFGGVYVGVNVGNHVGDWEHNMIRFLNGKPQAIWYSQHANGEAFTYQAVNKYKGLRPVVYSANGTHANYATNGTHAHDIPDVNLPNGLLVDHCDKGPLWDPTLSAYYFTYNAASKKFGAYSSTTPLNWLYFIGQWGDEGLSLTASNSQYPDSDPRQSCPFDISALCQYQSGPTGPEDKDLNRTQVCPDNGIACIVRPVLTP